MVCSIKFTSDTSLKIINNIFKCSIDLTKVFILLTLINILINESDN